MQKKKMSMCVEDKTVKWKQPQDKIEADGKVCISLFMVIYPTSSRLEFMESNAIPFNKPQVFDQIYKEHTLFVWSIEWGKEIKNEKD